MMITPLKNIFDGTPSQLPTEIVETLVSSKTCRVERIVSKGHASPRDFWYDQDQNEWVLVLQGAARLEFEDAHLDLKRGDFVNIVAHHRHRVAWTDPAVETIWLAIFYTEQ